MITLLILWFTWAGSLWGWATPPANAISIGIGVSWIVWLLVTAHEPAIAEFVTKLVSRGVGPTAGAVTKLETVSGSQMIMGRFVTKLVSRTSCRNGVSVTNGDRLPFCRIQIVKNLSPIAVALWTFLAVALVSGAFSVDRASSISRLFVLLAYLVAFYVVKRRYTASQVASGVVWAGWILFSLGVAEGLYRLAHGLSWELLLFSHRNTVAMIWGLMIPVGVGVLTGRRRLVWAMLGCGAMAFSGSRGGIMALAVAILVLWWPGLPDRIRWGSGAGILAGGLCLAVLVRGENTMDRLEMIGSAFQMFATSPLLGTGPGTGAMIWPGIVGKDWFHAHNLLLTIAMEMGIVGLAALAVVIRETWRMRHNAPRWAWAALCGFEVHSLVDEPLWFWGSGLGAVAMLALLSKGGVNVSVQD